MDTISKGGFSQYGGDKGDVYTIAEKVRAGMSKYLFIVPNVEFSAPEVGEARIYEYIKNIIWAESNTNSGESDKREIAKETCKILIELSGFDESFGEYYTESYSAVSNRMDNPLTITLDDIVNHKKARELLSQLN